MQSPADIVVSPAWEEIDEASLRGLVLVVGDSNVGKTTFAGWLLNRLGSVRPGPFAFLDGDPGQSKLGPPTTLTVALTKRGESKYPPSGRVWRWFVGSTTPRGHMLAHVVGTARLAEAAQSAGADTVICDTTGLINPDHGGFGLKRAKLSLLRPDVVIAIQREKELDSLTRWLRNSACSRLIEIPCSQWVRSLDYSERRRRRAQQLRQYFSGANRLEVDTSRLVIIPDTSLHMNQILALEDVDGFTLALAAVTRVGGVAEILTPLGDLGGVVTLGLGDLAVDPETGLGI
jgi:polynucleotide 5'-hydroxyl-kinase GRC3/NOL9